MEKPLILVAINGNIIIVLTEIYLRYEKLQTKKRGKPFFKEKLATEIHSLDVWESYHVDPKALEEVKPMFIT